MKETLAYELRELDSSIIESILYVERNQELFIEYKGGAIYQYMDVPIDTYNGIKFSESKGKYINTNVKGEFEYIKVDEEIEFDASNK